jgi:hypothetical protein
LLCFALLCFALLCFALLCFALLCWHAVCRMCSQANSGVRRMAPVRREMEPRSSQPATPREPQTIATSSKAPAAPAAKKVRKLKVFRASLGAGVEARHSLSFSASPTNSAHTCVQRVLLGSTVDAGL